MTLEQLEMTTIITNCVLSPILFLVGVPTNIISCLVFYKQGLRDRMNLCLFVLALVDTVYLVSVFVIGIHSSSACARRVFGVLMWIVCGQDKVEVVWMKVRV
nr:hypothetical protein BaRGS_002777 [Batillaria attramentaria]